MKIYYLIVMLLVLAPNITLAEKYSKYKRGVLKIITDNGSGTGFIVKGGVITALHVLLPNRPIKHFNDVQINAQSETCESKTVKLLKVDTKHDLALVSIPKCNGLLHFQTANYEPSRPRQLILSGYPDGLSVSLTGSAQTTIDPYTTLKHFLSEVRTDQWAGPNRHINVLNIDKEMLPGHSGAPLFNQSGRVVAVANGGRLNKPISWAVPWNKSINLVANDISGFNKKVQAKNNTNSKILYSSMRSNKGILTIEFMDGSVENVSFNPKSPSMVVDLGRYTKDPRFVKNTHSDAVVKHGISVDYKPSVKGANRHKSSTGFEFFIDKGHLLLEIQRPSIEINDNIIIDKKNKLMWSQKVQFMPWKQAQQYVAEARRKKFLGYNDWRLPSPQELFNLRRIAQSNPGRVVSSTNWQWSNSKYGLGSTAYAVNGGEIPGRDEPSIQVRVSESLPVRLVRSN